MIQFLTNGGGDAGQLAVSALDAFEPASMAVTEGTGFTLAQRALPLDEETATWLGVTAQSPPAEAAALDEESPWRDVLRFLDPDEITLGQLVQQLARQGLPAPIVGYELGDQGWPAELAWPDQRIAVVLTGQDDDPETEDRDRAYAGRAGTPAPRGNGRWTS